MLAYDGNDLLHTEHCFSRGVISAECGVCTFLKITALLFDIDSLLVIWAHCGSIPFGRRTVVGQRQFGFGVCILNVADPFGGRQKESANIYETNEH